MKPKMPSNIIPSKFASLRLSFASPTRWFVESIDIFPLIEAKTNGTSEPCFPTRHPRKTGMMVIHPLPWKRPHLDKLNIRARDGERQKVRNCWSGLNPYIQNLNWNPNKKVQQNKECFYELESSAKIRNHVYQNGRTMHTMTSKAWIIHCRTEHEHHGLTAHCFD